jgi:ABC-2 type transport system permease protein
MAKPDADGVIHDIGFRHYDGVRMGRPFVVRSLVADTLRGAFGIGRPGREKVTPWILVGCMMLPAFVMLIILVVGPGDEMPVEYNQYLIALQLVSALFVASRAPYALSRDLRDGVMPLYLSRPMTTRDYVIARFLGLTAGTTIFLVAPITLLFIGALLSELPPGEQITGFLLAIVLAAVLAVLISAIGLAIACFTQRRGIAMAGIVAVLLLTNGLSGVFYQILDSRGEISLAKYAVAFNPYGLVDGIGASVMGLTAGNDQEPPTTMSSGIIFVAVYLLILGVCALILGRRYRKVAAGA